MPVISFVPDYDWDVCIIVVSDCLRFDFQSENFHLPTDLQARYDLFCVKSAVKPQPTNHHLIKFLFILTDLCYWS